MTSGIESTGEVPGLKSVAIATTAPASSKARASGGAGAPRPRRAGGPRLVGWAPRGEARRARGARDGVEVVERERDVLDVDVDGIGEALCSCGGDELVADGADPCRALDALGHRVAGKQGDRARLHRLGREASRDPSLPPLALH